MKYIKLFENFEEQKNKVVSDDIFYDAMQAVISHLGDIKEVDLKNLDDYNPHMSDELISNVRVYNLLDSPNVKQLKSCEAHLIDINKEYYGEDYENNSDDHLFWNMNIGWYVNRVCVLSIGKSVEDFCLDWLRERFEHAEKYVNENENQVFYYDKDKNGVSNYDGGVSILNYYTNDGQADKYCSISYGKIWGFLKDIIGLEDYQIRSVLSKWLLEKFGLDLEPKKW